MFFVISRLILVNIVILIGYSYFQLVLILDVVATKTDHAVPIIHLFSEILPYLMVFVSVISLNCFIFSPFINMIRHDTSFKNMKIANKNHMIRIGVSKNKIRVGWFGSMKMFRIHNKVYIAKDTLIVHQNKEFKLNPVFISYLKVFRGYKEIGDHLIKTL